MKLKVILYVTLSSLALGVVCPCSGSGGSSNPRNVRILASADEGSRPCRNIC